jgi:hypothetical protein
MARKILDLVAVFVVMAGIGFFSYVGVTEFLDLRNRVDQIEKKLDTGFEIIIPLPDFKERRNPESPRIQPDNPDMIC